MDRQEILRELDAFPYGRGEYWVVAGAAMVLYGIRGSTGDIDLGCTKRIADRLEADGRLCGRQKNGKRRFRYGERFEIFEEWLFDRTETVDGFRVISLEGLIEMKTALGREKDLRDLALIEEYTRKQGKGETMEEQIITITVKSRGETCEMTDGQIREWYEQKIAALFDPKWGTPEITVEVKRKQV